MFSLDRVIGLKEPSMPGLIINVAVDELLKREFDKNINNKLLYYFSTFIESFIIF